jgi:hypothetical protein
MSSAGTPPNVSPCQPWFYLVQWAETLRGRPVLLIAAEDQKHSDMEALAAAIRQKDSVTLEYVEEETGHSFSDHRIALQTIVHEWPAELKKPAPSEKP